MIGIVAGAYREDVRRLIGEGYSEMGMDPDLVLASLPEGYVFSLIVFETKEVLAIGAIFPGSTERTGTAWVTCSSAIQKHPVQATKIIRRFLKVFMEERKMVKLFTAVAADSKRNLKWAKALGFEEEGLSRYHDGVSHFYYMGLIADVNAG